jgi:ABC-type branched-subunit amino acid transport system substrate-binding protein
VRRFRAIALFVALVTVLAACGRSSDETESGGGGGESTTTAPAAPAAGDFGDLEGVCGPGDGAGATAQGVTDTEINVATSSDPGFPGRAGLNQELFDAAEVFAKWCNEAGGINGRQIVLHEYDAAITNFKAQVVKACQTDFFLVGNGNVLDDSGQADRLTCMLPQIPSYVVSPEARDADLSVQPVPNRTDAQPALDLRYIAEQYPDSIDAVATLTAKELASTAVVEEQYVEAAESIGWDIVYRGNYAALGEPSWTPIAQSLKDNGAKGLIYTGEPQNLGLLMQALQNIGYELDFVVGSANHYDQALVEQAGSALKNTFIRVAIVPFEQADDNPATAQYLELFEKYKPSGKSHAALGPQAFSAWLLFAKAVKECGNEVTRKCVYDNALDTTNWTGGGLHAPQDVKNQKPGICGIMIEATADGFTTARGFEPNEGLLACDEENVITLTGDYGEGATLESVGKSLDDLE